jgi:hypothetical protein
MAEPQQEQTPLDEPVEIGQENRFLVEQLQEAERELERWKAQRERAREALIKLLAGHRSATIDRALAVRAIYVAPSTMLDSDKVKARYPSVFMNCQKMRRGSVRLIVTFAPTQSVEPQSDKPYPDVPAYVDE